MDRFGQRLADVDEGVEQTRQREPVFVAGAALGMVPLNRVRQSFTVDQLHRVERSPAAIHFVHQHNVRMLELPGDLRLFDQPPHRLARLETGLDLFERDLARQVVVPSQPNFAQPAFADLSDPGVPRLGGIGIVGGFAVLRAIEFVFAKRPNPRRLRQVEPLNLSQRREDFWTHHRLQRGSCIVAMPCEFAFDDFIEEFSVSRRKPTSRGEQVRQQFRRVRRPRSAHRDELVQVDQFALTRQDCEKQLAFGCHLGGPFRGRIRRRLTSTT